MCHCASCIDALSSLNNAFPVKLSLYVLLVQFWQFHRGCSATLAKGELQCLIEPYMKSNKSFFASFLDLTTPLIQLQGNFSGNHSDNFSTN